MEYVLTMIFVTAKGVKSTISVSGVKPTLGETEANALMDTIISKNIFLTTTGALVSKSEAKLTERKITKFDVA